MRNITILITLLCILLTGCGEKVKSTEPPIEEPIVAEPASNIMDSFTWNNITFDNLFPATIYEETEDGLKIFPCYSKDSYILVRKIVISDNRFWESVINQFGDKNNIRETESYSYVTTSNGKTVGYIQIDDIFAFVVSTETLPGGYVDVVLSSLVGSTVYQ